MPLTVGSRLGPYEILELLGFGGMGEVYRARDTRLDRTVAIKVLSPKVGNQPGLRERFEREARAVGSLNHPNICALYDIGHDGAMDFLVMEYLEGETLADRLRRRALPQEELWRYAIEIAGALAQAHRNGIVHRDLKPGNVLLTRSGAKLLDFGLAKLKDPGPSGIVEDKSSALTEERALTREGMILGTLQYMAPEQLQAKEADARSDIFAFGTVLYEMATGRKAFDGESQATLIGSILHTQPPSLSLLKQPAPPLLDHMIQRCLAKDPEERWQSAGDVMRGSSGWRNPRWCWRLRRQQLAPGVAKAWLGPSAPFSLFCWQWPSFADVQRRSP